ncbi:hypothetical protein OK006_6162, partial [Actinobacteria bacterium OK006]
WLTGTGDTGEKNSGKEVDNGLAVVGQARFRAPSGPDAVLAAPPAAPGPSRTPAGKR